MNYSTVEFDKFKKNPLNMHRNKKVASSLFVFNIFLMLYFFM